MKLKTNPDRQKASPPVIAVSNMFMPASSKLPAQIQRKVNNFISKFRQNLASSGINYEKLTDAASPDYRSARIDDNYRVIIAHRKDGNSHVLLWVGPHDDAYRWAKTHNYNLNTAVGAIHIYETIETKQPEAPAPAPAVVPEKTPAPAEKPAETKPAAAEKTPEKELSPPAAPEKLFAGLSEAELISLGVPEDRIAIVRDLEDKDALNEIRNKLPADVYEILGWLADGVPIEEVREAYPSGPADYETALKSKRTQRSFRVIESDEEMQKIMSAPLEAWRIFLHPDQMRLVKKELLTPTLVRGTAGTGKTVVAIHRAAELVGREDWDSSQKLLFTTFTRNLVVDIEQQLRFLCTERQFRQIEVVNIDAWVTRFLRTLDIDLRVVFPGSEIYDESWKKALSAGITDTLPESFYSEEWNRIILPQGITKESEYLKASRKGRGRSLSVKGKREVWPVFEEMRNQLAQKKCICAEDAFFLAAQKIREEPERVNYGAVVVDETQDLSAAALTMLAEIARPKAAPGDPPREPAIFLVGDGQQRIYSRTASLSACGINVRGRRSSRLRVTYRTTEEIRQTAELMLAGAEFDDMDGGTETRKGSIALRQGSDPQLFMAENAKQEIDWVCEQIADLTENPDVPEESRMKYRDICIVARTQREIDACRAGIKEKGLPVYEISRNTPDDPEVEGIRFATMHRVKGLEFKAVFVVRVNSDIIPRPRTEDETERRLKDLTERSLFYVAFSRARDALFVSCSGSPGEFFCLLEDRLSKISQKKER